MYFKSKYGAKKTIVDGITFASRLEAKQYEKLRERERNGEITNLVLQPEFILQESFKKNGKTFRKISYVADFMFEEKGKTHIQDVKGMVLDTFVLKQKLFEYKYPEYSLEIITSKDINKGD